MRFFDKLLEKPSDDRAGNEITARTTESMTVPSIITKAIAEREYNLARQ